MTRDELADELLEIRRYVRSNPLVARERLKRIMNNITVVDYAVSDHLIVHWHNIAGCLQVLAWNPESLEAHLDDAAFELRRGRKEG